MADIDQKHWYQISVFVSCSRCVLNTNTNTETFVYQICVFVSCSPCVLNTNTKTKTFVYQICFIGSLQSVCPKYKYKYKNIYVSDLCICVLQSVCPPNPWVIHHSLPHDCSPAGFLFLSTKGFSSTNVTRAWSNISTNIMEIWNK